MTNRINRSGEYYLRNVAKRWKRELANCESAYILSPYVTSRTAELVIELVKNVELYTCFQLENFANQSSSLSTLKKLFRKGVKLFSVDNLHAKIVLVPDSFASIGSQNLTNHGTWSKEATFVTRKSKDVKEIQTQLQTRWLKERKEITLEMIEDAEIEVRLLRKPVKKLREKIRASQAKVENLEIERELERQRRREELIRRNNAVKRIQNNLLNIGTAAEVYRGSVILSSDAYRFTYMAPTQTPNFLKWRLNDTSIDLSHHERYLALDGETGRLAWARVNKTCITYFADGVSFTQPVTLGSEPYALTVEANWDLATLDDYNLKLTLKAPYTYGPRLNHTIYVNFDIKGFRHRRSETAGDTKALRSWIKWNRQAFDAAMAEKMFGPFKYGKALTGVEADKFLGKWMHYDLRLARLHARPFFIFSRT